MSEQKSKRSQKRPDPDIVYTGTSITLPESPHKMPLPEAIKVLERKLEDEMTKMDVHEVIEHHPHDALVAFCWAMKETYGWYSPQTIKTFFGDINPDMVTVKTGPKDHEFQQLPCGMFKLPGMKEPIRVAQDFNGNQLHILGEVRKGDKQQIIDLVNKARERLRTHSIFRSKAIRLPVDEDGDPCFQDVSFIETDYIKPDELILNPDEMAQVEGSLWTPIKHTDTCVKHRIPLNRGVLLEGTYGTGKSMTANVTSKVCVDNGWTFILLDDVRALKEALLFAKRYEPCVIFAEDIDRAVEERDQTGNDILNTIDGILTKNSQIITVLTTNYVDKLDKAMLRPGRLDAVISVRPPEPEAVKRLIRLYGADLVAENDPLDRAAAELAGNIPATIRECVERSKLGMISRGDTKVTDDDLYISAVGMQSHMALLNAEKPVISKEEQLGKAFSDLLVFDPTVVEQNTGLLRKAARSVLLSSDKITESTGQLSRSVENSAQEVGERIEGVEKDTKAIRKAVT